MSTRLSFLSFAPLLLALPVLAQTPEPAVLELSPEAARIVAASRESSEVMQHLDYLTNAIGGRVTGSQDLVLACEWAASKFEGLGLTNVHLEEWGEVPVAFDRGPWFGAMMWTAGDVTQRVVLEFNTPAWSAGTKGLRRGKALLQPKDEEAFRAVEKELAGAWLVQTRSGRQSGRGQRRGQAQAGDAAPRFDVLQACRDAGILGVISASRDSYLRTGNARGVNWRALSLDKLPTVAQIQMLPDQFKQLNEMLAAGNPVDLEFNIQNRFRRGPVKLLNVIADITGTEKPDEFVLVGGHIDSWDGATGAVDNGSGCATAMEAARLILAAGVKPKRTIRFVLWGGEEQGLLGSRAYVQQHQDELAKISAYLNHDSGTNYVAGATCTEAMKADLESVFAGVSGIDEDMPFALRVTEGLRGGGSDHSSLISAGVPAWSWSLKGDHNYRHIWHTQHDLYDEVVESYQRHSAMVIAIGAVGIANLDNLLSREKMTAPRGERGQRSGRFNPGVELDGTKIVSVEKDSAFAKGGFKKGDVLLQVGATEVQSLREVYMAAFRAEGPVEVTVLRGGKKVKLKFAMQRR